MATEKQKMNNPGSLEAAETKNEREDLSFNEIGKNKEEGWKDDVDDMIMSLRGSGELDYYEGFAEKEKEIVKQIVKEGKEKDDFNREEVLNSVELRYFGYFYQVLVDVYYSTEDESRKREVIKFFYDSLSDKVNSNAKRLSHQFLSKTILMLSRHSEDINDFASNREIAEIFLEMLTTKKPSLHRMDYLGIVNIFSKDSNYCISKLFELLNTTDVRQKEVVGIILRNLEFGNKKVDSQGVVKYLNKDIELIDKERDSLEQENLYTSRISSDGDFGVFNEDDELEKYFHVYLNDITSEEKRVAKELVDFSVEDLFMEKEGEPEKEKEKKKGYLEAFKKNYHKIFDEQFSGGAVSLNNLTLKEQGWFLVYFNESDEEKKERIRQFVDAYRELGIKTFFSLESGWESGELVLELGKLLEGTPYVAEEVFSKYAEMVDSMDEIAEEAQEIYREVLPGKDVNKNEVKSNLLKKANYLLKKAYEKIKESKGEVESGEIVDELIGDLRREDKVKSEAIDSLKDFARGVIERSGESEEDGSNLQARKALEKQLDEFVYDYQAPELPEEMDDNLAHKVFRKYSEIVHLAQSSKKQIKELFKEDQELSGEELEKISQNIMKEANAVIQSYSNLIQQEGFSENLNEAFLQKINNIGEGERLRVSVLKTLRKGFSREDVSFEKMKGAIFKEVAAGDYAGNDPGKIDSLKKVFLEGDEKPVFPASMLTGSLREVFQMFSIYAENYSEMPEIRAELLRGFSEKLKKGGENTKLFMYKQDGDVVAFNRIDLLKNGEKYFASFNVKPNLASSTIGTALFQTVLESEMQDSEVVANCDAFSAVSSFYIETGGFVVENFDPEFDPEANIADFSIRRYPDKKFFYQQLSKKNLQEMEHLTPEMIHGLDSDKFILRLPDDYEEQKRIADLLINKKNYVMTRFIINKDSSNIACFEKR